MKQLHRGLKESSVVTMIKERPALAEVLFPRSAEQVMDSQVIASHRKLLTVYINIIMVIVIIKLE